MFFERPESTDVSVLVHVNLRNDDREFCSQEFDELARSAGAIKVADIYSSPSTFSPSFLVGKGKLEEIHAAVRNHGADLVLFSRELTPAQERNLEKFLGCRVLDRNGLILDIFAQRARSHEGKLQVELAQLQHLISRLKRGWSHLDRQKGGIGLRGAGEKQLELDQRMIRARIKSINKNLTKVRRQREQGRRSRSRSELPTISLVGYTNAGKSSLFNELTRENSYVADKLFATLDSTLRKFEVNNFGKVVLADTVGFIRHLPHTLVDAFRATLEEVASANLLIHVVDYADDAKFDRVGDVNEVLEEIGAEAIPQVIVFNKIDKIDNFKPKFTYGENGLPEKVWVSAHDNLGIDLLHKAIAENLGGSLVSKTIRLSAGMARLRSELYGNGFVESERVDETGGSLLGVRLPRDELDKLQRIGAKIVVKPALEVTQDKSWTTGAETRSA